MQTANGIYLSVQPTYVREDGTCDVLVNINQGALSMGFNLSVIDAQKLAGELVRYAELAIQKSRDVDRVAGELGVGLAEAAHLYRQSGDKVFEAVREGTMHNRSHLAGGN
jgi:hypothetical protein